MKHVFIVNPNAGRGKGQKIISKIESVCKTEKLDYEIRLITKNLSGAEIASEYKEEENIIFVVGGDGTITKTISGIAGTKNKLGIIPAGSGNDPLHERYRICRGRARNSCCRHRHHYNHQCNQGHSLYCLQDL